MEQEITHYSRGKLHVGQIIMRESALTQNNCLKLARFARRTTQPSPRETGIVDVLFTHSISTLYNSL
jgi:hypothetical protein